ncbi:hypothetical protein [Deinococcus sp. LM3]|uniref:hypothetical protein n=1 Tax=Deinococcus sp. LM3 TaxID=1938608 RepID=UPI000994045E|nr:hypothetical protein [Deinococcus sp. LM3]OOV11364.1 hypothetical protein BXU09_20065 [Deinococcus sp. LM3]
MKAKVTGVTAWQGTPTGGTLSIRAPRYVDSSGNASPEEYSAVLDVSHTPPRWMDALDPTRELYVIVQGPDDLPGVRARFYEVLDYGPDKAVRTEFTRKLISSDLNGLIFDYAMPEPTDIPVGFGDAPLTMRAAQQVIEEGGAVVSEWTDIKVDIAQSAALATAAAGITPRDNIAAITGPDGYYRAMDTGYVYQRETVDNLTTNTRRRDLEAATGTLARNGAFPLADYLPDPGGSTDHTAAVTAWLQLSGSQAFAGRTFTGSGLLRVRPGELIINNPYAAGIIGPLTIIPSAPGAGAILTLGNGTFEPSDLVIRDLKIDLNGQDGPAFHFRRTNIFHLSDVQARNIGAGGTGFTNEPGQMFQEMYFTRLQVWNNSVKCAYGVDFTLTGNAEFHSANIEQAQTGMRLRGAGLCAVKLFGGHFERMGAWAIDAEDVQLRAYGPELYSGGLRLGHGCVGGDIDLGYLPSIEINAGIVDLGIGNRIRRLAAQPATGAARTPSLDFDGGEWYRAVSNAVTDPTFTDGATGWTATNATLGAREHVAPGAKTGKALTVTGTASGGYAERTVTVDANSDYLLSAVLLMHTDNLSNARVAVLDAAGTTTIYDSGTLDYSLPALYGGTKMRWRVHRKRIPTGSNTTLRIRIYSNAAGVATVLPALLLTKSLYQMADGTTGGTGAGSGTDYTLSKSAAGAMSMTAYRNGSSKNLAAYAYFRVTALTGEVLWGAGGDSNNTSAGEQFTIRETGEYCLPLGSLPVNGVTRFYTYSGPASITISDLCLIPIQQIPGESGPPAGQSYVTTTTPGEVRLPTINQGAAGTTTVTYLGYQQITGVNGSSSTHEIYVGANADPNGKRKFAGLKVVAQGAFLNDVQARLQASYGGGADAKDVAVAQLDPFGVPEFQVYASGWNTGRFRFGTAYDWISAAGLRRSKQGAPSSDTDGAPTQYRKLQGTTHGTIGTTTIIGHGLGYAPTHIIVVPRGAGAVYYTAVDATDVTVAATAANVPYDVYVG